MVWLILNYFILFVKCIFSILETYNNIFIAPIFKKNLGLVKNTSTLLRIVNWAKLTPSYLSERKFPTTPVYVGTYVSTYIREDR